MKKLAIYESSDGNRWESEQDCKEWESFLPLLQRYAKTKDMGMLRRIEFALSCPGRVSNSKTSI